MQRKVTPPFLLRFPQILDTQIKEFHEAFRNSIAEYNYGARHRGVFPDEGESEAQRRGTPDGRGPPL